MDTNERFRGIEETLSDVLVEVQHLRQGQKSLTKSFDWFGDAMLAKLAELTDGVKGMHAQGHAAVAGPRGTPRAD